MIKTHINQTATSIRLLKTPDFMEKEMLSCLTECQEILDLLNKH